MRIDVLTIFPKMFDPVLNESIVKRAQAKGKVKIRVHDLRDYTSDKHRKVDDRPFGGGAGMVIRPEPVFNLVKAVAKKGSRVVLLSPQGKKLDQARAKKLKPFKPRVTGGWLSRYQRLVGPADIGAVLQ